MNRKSFIKYSAMVGGAIILQPKHIFAAPKTVINKTILCIWGEGVQISHFKILMGQLLCGENVQVEQNFNLKYEGELHAHNNAMSTISSEISNVININILNDNFDASDYLNNNANDIIIIRFTGCDAAHYNNNLYHTALEKYQLYTQNIMEYLQINNLYHNGCVLMVATEMGRDLDGGEIQLNSGIECSHHLTEDARITGVLAFSNPKYANNLKAIHQIKTTKYLLKHL